MYHTVKSLPPKDVDVRIEGDGAWAVYVRNVREQTFTGSARASEAWAYAEQRREALDRLYEQAQHIEEYA